MTRIYEQGEPIGIAQLKQKLADSEKKCLDQAQELAQAQCKFSACEVARLTRELNAANARCLDTRDELNKAHAVGTELRQRCSDQAAVIERVSIERDEALDECSRIRPDHVPFVNALDGAMALLRRVNREASSLPAGLLQSVTDALAAAPEHTAPEDDECCSDPYECWKELRGQLAAAITRNQELGERLQAAAAAQSELEGKLDAANARVAELEREGMAAHDAYNEALHREAAANAHADAAEKGWGETVNDRTRLQIRVRELESEAADLRAESIRKAREISEWMTYNERLKTEAAALRSEFDHQKRLTAEQYQTIRAQQKQAERYQDEAAALRAEVETAFANGAEQSVAECNALRAEVERLTAANARVAELERAALAQHDAYNEGLHRAAEGERAAIASADAAERSVVEWRAKYASACQARPNHEAHLRVEVARLRGETERLEDECNDSNVAVSLAESERDEWKAKCEAADLRANGLTQSFEAAVDKLTRAESEAAALRAENAKLQEWLDKNKVDGIRLRAEVKALQEREDTFLSGHVATLKHRLFTATELLERCRAVCTFRTGALYNDVVTFLQTTTPAPTEREKAERDAKFWADKCDQLVERVKRAESEAAQWKSTHDLALDDVADLRGQLARANCLLLSAHPIVARSADHGLTGAINHHLQQRDVRASL
jgi:chromosome segregation ATPase